MNCKIIHDKINYTVGMSVMDFHFLPGMRSYNVVSFRSHIVLDVEDHAEM